jgi:tetratricopeptide (TPR) repeat protein
MQNVLPCLLGLLGLTLSAPTLASNPELLARESGIEDQAARSHALRLGQLDLHVDVTGGLADVTLLARFENPSSDTLEGDFSFDLPPGAVVTGYALDVGEHMIDGVLVDTLKAERAYETQVRQGIDPGIAKVSRANRFSTRVFPIPDNGSRTIRLEFSAPLHAVHGLLLPLETGEPVGKVLLSVRAVAVKGTPHLTLPNNLEPHWESRSDAWTARATLHAVPLQGAFAITAQPRHPATATRHHNGKRTVHIVDSAPRARSVRSLGNRLRVYWDRSLSRRDQALAAELALLARYIDRVAPASIDLVVFNSSGATVDRVAAADVDARLREVLYRGATSYAVLEKLAAPDADVCLVFTDGVATIDARPRFSPGCETFVITTAADADPGFLRRLAGGVAESVLHLGARDESEALRRLMGGAPRVVKVMNEDGRELPHATLESAGNGWSIITEAPATGAVVLRIAGLRGSIVEKRYEPSGARSSPFDAGGALWARDRAAQLASEDDSREEFLGFARRFSIAGQGLSFLVLEEPGDYVAADIEPPASYPSEGREEYRRIKAESDEEKRAARDERLAEVRAEWEAVVGWWNTRFDPQAPRKMPREEKAMLRALAAAPSVAREDVVDSIQAEDIGSFPAANVAESLSRIVVTGTRAAGPGSIDVHRSIDVQLAEWSPSRTYLQALDAASPADLARVLAEQERLHGMLPAFYFDVAEWFHRRGRMDEAVELLLSALELPIANEETALMVADRLMRYRHADRAIWLHELAVAQTDYLPQPRRSLALALARRAELAVQDGDRGQARADLQRAVRLLNDVVITPWEADYDGIEVVSLMEANALLPRLAALGGADPPLDERLRALLDVDLRVVVEWNTNATDMDLHIDEPNGEEAFYSNPMTAIGGRMSNDMTQGYGPEEYLLRRAATGKYRVRVHGFARDAINPNGSTIITARLFRDFGRPAQREQTMEIELRADDEGDTLIGTFEVQ